MYLFNRTRQAKSANTLEATTGAIQIAEKVSQLTNMDVSVWTSRFGAPVGTMMWSVRLESQAQLFQATEKMMADASYIEMATAMTEFYEGPATDRLARVISGTPSPTPPRFISTTEATMTNGRYAEAIQWGAEMQAFVAAELSQATMFATAAYGGFADVVWITGAESAAELDAGQEWQMANERYHEMINSAAGLFVEESGQQGLLEKIN